MAGVRDYSTGELKHNVVALAKAAKSRKLPIIVTTTARDSTGVRRSHDRLKRCRASGLSTVHRSSVNAFDDACVARAIEATGSRKLILTGIPLEVCAAFSAITAVGRCWIVSDHAMLIVEILKDNARPQAGEVYAVMDMPWAKLVGDRAQVRKIKRPQPLRTKP
jgi:nicotinamidase-related amidase